MCGRRQRRVDQLSGASFDAVRSQQRQTMPKAPAASKVAATAAAPLSAPFPTSDYAGKGVAVGAGASVAAAAAAKGRAAVDGDGSNDGMEVGDDDDDDDDDSDKDEDGCGKNTKIKLRYVAPTVDAYGHRIAAHPHPDANLRIKFKFDCCQVCGNVTPATKLLLCDGTANTMFVKPR